MTAVGRSGIVNDQSVTGQERPVAHRIATLGTGGAGLLCVAVTS